MFNFGFIGEQALGHITHYQNLKYWVGFDSNIEPSWMPVGGGGNDIWNKLPFIRNNWSLQVSLRTRKEIKAAIERQALDALFIHTQSLALFAIPFMHRIPTIISTDATPINLDRIASGYNHKVGSNYFAELAKFHWNKNTFNAARALVTWSQWAKDSLVSDYGIPADKVTVIPPGVDLEQWNFRDKQIVDNTHTNPLRLLFVGGDFARKGGYTLLEAFRNGLNQDCILDIVTKDITLKQELAGVENIRVHCNFTPNCQPLKQLYAQADVFVFPTEADSFGIVALEAMAAGLPIITTDIAALPELVEDKVNGLIVPPNNANALSNALQALQNDRTKITAMAAASVRIVEKRFDAKRNYGAVISLMKSISQESDSQYSPFRLSTIQHRKTSPHPTGTPLLNKERGRG